MVDQAVRPAGTGPAVPPSDDSFFSGRSKCLQILQPRTGFRAGLDSVILAAAISAKPGEHLLELGVGPGVVSMCIAERLRDVKLTGLELQNEFADLARRNAARNGFSDRVIILDGDVADPPTELLEQEFDQVIFNPPFILADQGTRPPDPNKAQAHVLSGAAVSLRAWIDCALTHLKPKGRLTLVHRADKLDEILVALNGRAGGVVVFPLWPAAGRTAKRMLLSARKGVASALTLKAGLVLMDENGQTSQKLDAIARYGEALDILSR